MSKTLKPVVTCDAAPGDLTTKMSGGMADITYVHSTPGETIEGNASMTKLSYYSGGQEYATDYRVSVPDDPGVDPATGFWSVHLRADKISGKTRVVHNVYATTRGDAMDPPGSTPPYRKLVSVAHNASSSPQLIIIERLAPVASRPDYVEVHFTVSAMRAD